MKARIWFPGLVLTLVLAGLGICSGQGHSLTVAPKEVPALKQRLTALAEQGDPDAMMRLGILFRNFPTETGDKEKGLRCLKMAAQRGNVPAIDLVREILVGTPPVLTPEAEQWLIFGMERGSATATQQLGSFLLDHPDPRKKAQWPAILARAAAAGNAKAMYLLAELSYFGDMVPHDLQLAYQRHCEAFKAGCLLSGPRLAELLMFAQIDRKDFRRAHEVLMASRDCGSPLVHTKLGQLYESGHLEPPNRQKAWEWYREGVRRRSPFALLAFGSMYELGDHVPRDPVKAWVCFAAARQLFGGESSVPLELKRRLAFLERELTSEQRDRAGKMLESRNFGLE